MTKVCCESGENGVKSDQDVQNEAKNNKTKDMKIITQVIWITKGSKYHFLSIKLSYFYHSIYSCSQFYVFNKSVLDLFLYDLWLNL